MNVSEFDFDLPEDRIALRPVEPKDSSRLMVVDGGGNIYDQKFTDLIDYLDANDIIVFNDTKVIPAQLQGTCRGLDIECNLHKRLGPVEWIAFAKKVKRLRKNDVIEFGPSLRAFVMDVSSDDQIGQLTLRL